MIAAALLVGACGERPTSRNEAGTLPAAPPSVVDSALGQDVALIRFQAGSSTHPTTLRGGRPSREALLAEVVQALAESDTAAFEPIAMDRAEFAHLYFSTSPVAKPPYELPPALAWMQIQETNRKSVFRSLGAYGGKDLRFLGYRCAPDPMVQGANRIWHDCVVTMRSGSDTLDARLVGGIIERGGVFKVLSYASDR